jgi:hypothetical protein
MTQLTRWVLAHKRLVVVFWVALTLVGMASAGSATKALKQKFSVPGKEGWVANQAIAGNFGGTGGNTAPLLPVVTLAAGATVGSPSVVGARAAARAGSPCATRHPRQPREAGVIASAAPALPCPSQAGPRETVPLLAHTPTPHGFSPWER